MSSFKLAWIGVAHIHTPGFSQEVLRRGIGCAGVFDPDAARAQKNAEILGGPVISLQDAGILDADGYVITSETCRHLEFLEPIASTKRPIFIEKPLGTDADQSIALRDMLEKNEVVFQTGYGMRGDAKVRTVRRLLLDGFFGTVTRLRASVCHNGALGGWFDGEWRWMADRAQAGVGAFGDLGTHGLDLLMWLMGEVERATGALSMGTGRYPGCDEFGEGLMRFKNGAIGTLTASWDDIANPVRLQIAGTEGHALLNGDLLVGGKDGKMEVVTDLDAPVAAGFYSFLDFLAGQEAELVSAREATERDIVMDAMYRGAESGTWVDLRNG